MGTVRTESAIKTENGELFKFHGYVNSSVTKGIQRESVAIESTLLHK